MYLQHQLGLGHARKWNDFKKIILIDKRAAVTASLKMRHQQRILKKKLTEKRKVVRELIKKEF